MTRKVLITFDKTGAEWVVVAYLTEDPNMLKVVDEKKDPHVITGSLISGAPEDLVARESKLIGETTDPDIIRKLRKQLPELLEGDYFLPRTMSIRQCGKKSNHGLNYGEGKVTFALVNETDETEATRIIHLYREVAYPGIPKWYEKTKSQLKDNRLLENCFGRKRHFMDAWGPDLFNSAYAFIPQSTVFDICRVGMVKAYNNNNLVFAPAELLMHTHDSNTYQYPSNDISMIQGFIYGMTKSYMNSECHYNGRDFYIDTTVKIGYSLGEMEEVTISSVREVLEVLDEKEAIR